MQPHTAIVTGASRGLGRALALHLASHAWGMVINGRDRPELARAAADIQSLTSEPVIAIPGDVSDPDHAASLVAAADRIGGLTLLVNNASMLGPSPQPALADYPLNALARVFDVNVFAPLRLIQLALPALRKVSGSVVNITSDAATEAYAGWGGYGSSKAALEHLSSVLAAEEPEVRVLSIDPGDMQTRMHQQAFPGQDISDRPAPEERVPGIVRILDAGMPSGRYRAADFLVELA